MMARLRWRSQLCPVLGTDQKISQIARGGIIKRDTSFMRARYKLSREKTLSYIRGYSWTGRLTIMGDMHAILYLFMLHAIWTMHAFKMNQSASLSYGDSEECRSIRERDEPSSSLPSNK
jgi:hypothetical protein